MEKAPTRAQLEAAVDAERLKETNQVAAQPHRNGDRGDMVDALGNFVRKTFQSEDEQELGRMCYEACNKYIAVVAMWRRIKGVPQHYLIEDETRSKGRDIADEDVKNLTIKIHKAEEAMKCYGLSGFHAAKDLILDGVFPISALHGPVKRAIIQLSVCLGFYTK